MENDKMVVCDHDALDKWRAFCIEHRYDANDIHARRAFGAGYLAGAVFGCEEAMKAAKSIIMGEAA
jgi:hypothetical protein